jgi:hypothetical protein
MATKSSLRISSLFMVRHWLIRFNGYADSAWAQTVDEHVILIKVLWLLYILFAIIFCLA